MLNKRCPVANEKPCKTILCFFYFVGLAATFVSGKTFRCDQKANACFANCKVICNTFTHRVRGHSHILAHVMLLSVEPLFCYAVHLKTPFCRLHYKNKHNWKFYKILSDPTQFLPCVQRKTLVWYFGKNMYAPFIFECPRVTGLRIFG